MKIKKQYQIIIGMVAIIVLFVSIIAIINNSNKKSQEEILTDKLNEIGKNFYENYYYDLMGSELIENFSDTGITITLRTLDGKSIDGITNDLDMFVNKKTKKECDKDATKIIYTVKEPYGKTDYEMKVVLECGFDKK